MSASTVRSLPPVYFVLGGPGSGKGTQCQKLVSRFALKQVCAGDLLREKAVADDDVGRLVAEKIRTGQIVPGHITIELLHAALQRYKEAPGILIDGFPREIQQAKDFELTIMQPTSVIYFHCGDDEMKARLQDRGLTSGRVDDTSAVIEKRLETFRDVTMPVLDFYSKQKNLLRVFDANRAPDEIFMDLSCYFKDHLLYERNQELEAVL